MPGAVVRGGAGRGLFSCIPGTGKTGKRPDGTGGIELGEGAFDGGRRRRVATRRARRRGGAAGGLGRAVPGPGAGAGGLGLAAGAVTRRVLAGLRGLRALPGEAPGAALRGIPGGIDPGAVLLLRGGFGCRVVRNLGALNSSPAARNGSAGLGKMPAVSSLASGILMPVGNGASGALLLYCDVSGGVIWSLFDLFGFIITWKEPRCVFRENTFESAGAVASHPVISIPWKTDGCKLLEWAVSSLVLFDGIAGWCYVVVDQ